MTMVTVKIRAADYGTRDAADDRADGACNHRTGAGADGSARERVSLGGQGQFNHSERGCRKHESTHGSFSSFLCVCGGERSVGGKVPKLPALRDEKISTQGR